MTPETFAEVRADWNDDLKRTDIFAKPDPAPPLPSPNIIGCGPGRIAQVLAVVAGIGGMSVKAITGSCLEAGTYRYRALAALVAYDLTDKNWSQIAYVMNRDRSTIRHAVQRARQFMKDPSFRAEYDQALRMLA